MNLLILFLGLISVANNSMCASAIGSVFLRGSACIADSSKQWKCLQPCPDHPGEIISTIRERDGEKGHNHTNNPSTWYDVHGRSVS